MPTPVKRQHTNLELLNIASKIWAKTEDIMALGDCGYNVAHKTKKEIEKQILAEGKKIAGDSVVPMKRVLKYFDINIKDLEQTVLREERIRNAKKP